MDTPATYPQFFDAQKIGESLREVSSHLMKNDNSKLVGRWFQGKNDIDLFIWVDEKKQIVKQQLTFFGQVVEWNAIEGNKTGVVIDDERAGRKRSEVIRFDKEAHPQPLGLAMEVIQHANVLTEKERKQIIANYFKGQKIVDGDPHEFARRFASTGTPFDHWASFREKIWRILRKIFKP